MNNSVMDLSVVSLSCAYIFVLLLIVFMRVKGIKKEKMLVIATLRMTIQLTLMGYVLMYVFARPSWWLTLLMIASMLGFAIYNALQRIKHAMPRELKKLIALSMICGYASIAVVFLLLVLQVKPWYNPQYIIPISGMIVGNAMTGISLGANRLCAGMAHARDTVENSLMLGATPKEACKEIANDAFDSAILPTISNMMTMGIVSLPGMMTGQILSGTFPMTAIKYQIGIMLAILGCTAITVFLFVSLGYKTFFTKSDALKENK